MKAPNRGQTRRTLNLLPDGVQATQYPARLIHHADNTIMYALDAKWKIHAEHQVDRVTVVFL